MDLKLIEKLNEFAHAYPDYDLLVSTDYRDVWNPFVYICVMHDMQLIELGDMSELKKTYEQNLDCLTYVTEEGRAYLDEWCKSEGSGDGN